MTEVAERNLMKEWANGEINNALCSLPFKHRDIIRLYFGLSKDNRERSAEEIAQLFGITKGRVYAIRKDALKRLSNYFTKNLKEEMGNFKEAINDR